MVGGTGEVVQLLVEQQSPDHPKFKGLNLGACTIKPITAVIVTLSLKYRVLGTAIHFHPV